MPAALVVPVVTSSRARATETGSPGEPRNVNVTDVCAVAMLAESPARNTAVQRARTSLLAKQERDIPLRK
jgi:hypothetical protein